MRTKLFLVFITMVLLISLVGCSEAPVTPVDVGTPQNFVLLSPVADASGIIDSTTLSWAVATNATSYQVLVADNIALENALYDQNVGDVTNVVVSGLLDVTDYYWQVIAINDNGNTTNIGSSRHFTTGGVPLAFLKTSPSDNSSGQDIDLQLQWAVAPGATNYLVVVSTNSDLSLPDFSGNVGNVTVKDLTGLSSFASYYWQVSANNAFGSTIASGGPWKFITSSNPANIPADFTLVSPANATTSQATNINLSWNASTRATNYTLQIATDSGFIAMVYNSSLGDVTSKDVVLAGLGATYYWRVKASNIDGEKWNTGGARSFTTFDIPEVFSYSSPLNGSSGYQPSTTLSWNAATGAVSYNLVVSANSDLSTPFYDSNVGSATSKIISGFSIASTTYYWRVTAINAIGERNGVTWNLTTANIPADFTLSSPANNATGSEANVTLSWATSATATNYIVEFSANSDLSAPIFNGSVGNVTSKAVTGASANTTYYWRVTSYNAFGSKVTSSGTWSYVTGDVPGAFSLLGPSNATNYTISSPTVSWNAASNATTYLLVVSKNADLSSPVHNTLVGNTTSKYISGLEGGTTYYWKVTASNSWGNQQNAGGNWSFQTAALSSALFWSQRMTDNVWEQVPATKVITGNYCEIYIENAQMGTVSIATAAAIATEFDNNIYNLIRNKFAVESDVDSNGKITIFITDIKDGYSGSGGYVAGYFHGLHELVDPNSNKADMLFMDCYPAVVGSADFYATIAHEFQHLVNFNKKYLTGGGLVQDTWVNEGLSSAAEYLYQGSHAASRIAYYNADPAGAIGMGQGFLTWDPSYGDTLASYATAYLFFQWLRIHASNGDGIYKDILNDSNTDYQAVQAAAVSRIYGTSRSWGLVLRDWYIANLFNDTTGVYGYKSEITTTPNYISSLGGYGAGLTWDLLPGEGVYAAMASAHTISGGTMLDYVGLNSSTSAIDTTSSYSGDTLLSYSQNGVVGGSYATTGGLPSYTTPPISVISRSVSKLDLGKLSSFRVDAVFNLDGSHSLEGGFMKNRINYSILNKTIKSLVGFKKIR